MNNKIRKVNALQNRIIYFNHELAASATVPCNCHTADLVSKTKKTNVKLVPN